MYIGYEFFLSNHNSNPISLTELLWTKVTSHQFYFFMGWSKLLSVLKVIIDKNDVKTIHIPSFLYRLIKEA